MPTEGSEGAQVQASELAGSDAINAPFIEAMSRLACGIVMVTTVIEGVPWGMTVSACCSVSADPPLLLVALASRSASVNSIRSRGRFGVSILGAQSVEVARFGSAPGRPKYMPHYCGVQVAEEEHPLRSPGIHGALAHVNCTVAQEIEGGDHIIFIGSVNDVSGVASPAVWDSPLVYYRRGYHTLSDLQNAFST